MGRVSSSWASGCTTNMPHLREQIILGTKFGEHFDDGVTSVDLTATGAKEQFERSVQRLGKVDLLYSHNTSQVSESEAAAVLADRELTQYLRSLKETGAVQFLGTSISHSGVLEQAMEAGRLGHLDVIQIPSATVFDQRQS